MDFSAGDCVFNMNKLKSMILDDLYESALSDNNDNITIAELLHKMEVIFHIKSIGTFPEGE